MIKLLVTVIFFNLSYYCFAQADQLDNTFGREGKVTTNITPSYDDYGYTVLIQEDGKIIVAGYAYNGPGSNSNFNVVRYNIDGTLDETFGSGGKVTTDFNFSQDYNNPGSAAIQPDGKIIVAGYSSDGSNYNYAVVRYNTDGSLDSSFGTTGKITTDFGSSGDYAYAVAVQNNGKIVVAGYASDGINSGCGIARYNSDGNPDPTFDSDGLVITGSLPNGANAVSIQADGKIVVAGYYFNGVNSDFIVARYNTDGSLDGTFDLDGIALADLGDYDYITSLAVYGETGDEKIITAGYSYNGINYDFALVRFNSDGSLDNSFGSSGKLKTDIQNSDDYSYSVKIQADDKIIVAGSSSIMGSDNDFTVIRYNTDGTVDNSFGNLGRVITDFSGNYDNAYSIAVHSDGSLIAAGYAQTPTNGNDFAAARYNSDGTPDNSFGIEGKITTDLGSTQDYAYSAAIQTDGKIIVSGTTYVGTHSNLAVVRYNDDGKLDDSFGSGGRTITDLGEFSYGNSVLVQPDNTIIVAGSFYTGFSYDFLVNKYTTDGQLDNSFGSAGSAVTDVLSFDDFGNSVILQPDGKIILGGYSSNGSDYDFSIVRYNPDGSPDTGFDTDGIAAFNFGGADYGNSVALQSDGKIVLGGYSFNANFDFALVRFNPDGSIDNTFGSGGKVLTDFENTENYGNSVIIQPDDKIILAGYTYNGSTFNLSLARYNQDGSPDNTFGNEGKVILDLEASFGYSLAAALQSDDKIIIGWNYYNGSNLDFALVRFNTDGSLDNSFSNDGKLFVDFNGKNEYANALAIQSDGKIVAAGTANNGYDEDFALIRYNVLYPQMDLSQTSLDFGEINTGNSFDLTFSITNTGDAPLVVDSIVNKSNVFITDPINFTINQGNSLDIKVTFTPEDTLLYTDTLIIYSNAPVNPTLVTLSGKGSLNSFPVISSSAATLDFGEVTVNNSLQRFFYIRNAGTAGLQVTDIQSGNGVFIPDTTNFSIAPGDSQMVTVTFTPTEAIAYEDSLNIVHNAAGSPFIVRLNGTGTINQVAIINYSATVLNFGEVTVNNSLQRFFYIRNEGNANLNVTNIQSSDGAFIPDVTSFIVAPGDSQRVNVTFTPTASVAYDDTLRVEHNAAGSPGLIRVNGSGTANEVAIINFTVTALNFGEVTVNNSQQRSFFIKNEGTADLQVANIISSNAAFSADTINFNVPPGDSQMVTITFTPTESITYNDTLWIEHNASGSPGIVTLTGTGIGGQIAAIQLSTGSLDFGDVKVSVSRQKNFTIRNIGEVVLLVAILASDDDFNVSPENFTVPAGDSQVVIVTFTPSEERNYNGSLSVASNASINPNTINLSGTGFNYPSSISLNMNTSFGNVENTGNYRIIGIPGGNNVSVNLQGTYEYDWQVYWDNGAETNYLINSNSYSFSPGKAYWILSKNPLTLQQQVNTVPIDDSEYVYSIPLHPGWNLISTPFDKPTPWASVLSINSLPANSELKSWQGSYSNASVMEPYKGYYFNNLDTYSIDSLKIPYEPGGSGLARKQNTGNIYPFDFSELLTVSVTGENKKYSAEAFLGIDTASEKGFDEMDYFAGPDIFQKINVSFVINEMPKRSRNFYIEHRPEIGEGQEYDLEIKAVSNQLLEIEISEPENFSVFNIYLLDERLNNLYNIREKNKIELRPAHQYNAFKLYIGTDEFINEIKEKILPPGYELFQNYPNPFNPNTVIRFSLKEAERLTLKIYNILGELTATLIENEFYEAGFYETVFNGSGLASGVYILRMDAGKYSSQKKMILMK